MKIFDSLRFPFDGPRPWANIGLLGVAQMIPVIGPIIVLGYGCLVEKALVRDWSAPAPAFDFHYFAKYLERGIMPFLVQLVITMPLVLVFVVAMWIAMAASVFLGASAGHHPTLIAVLIVIGIVSYLSLMLLLPVLMLPFVLRASLLGEFTGAFNFRWALDFYKRVGGAAWVSLFLLQLAALPIMLAGVLCCYVGMFFSAGIVHLILWHVQTKLYHLYLDRGGTPLVILEEMPAPAFPVVQHTIPSAPPPIQQG